MYEKKKGTFHCLFLRKINFDCYTVSLHNLPFSNLAGFVSIPITRDAPDFLQPKATARPTAPKPHIAHVLPDSTLAVFKAAP